MQQLVFQSESILEKILIIIYIIQNIKNCMSNSRLMENSIRPKIFQEWPRRQDHHSLDHQQRDEKRIKPHQSLRAQQALEKSLFFITNINTFLQLFDEHKLNCSAFSQSVEKIQGKLEDLSQQNNKDFNSTQYKNQLREYFLQIRKGGILLRQIRTFCLCNLQNYNSKTTQMKFSRSDKEADEILHQKINFLENKRRRVQQTLVGYQYDIPESIILGEEKNFQNCLLELIHSMEPDQLIDYHYLMLYKLKQLEELAKRHEKLMVASNQNYSRYQGLHDSSTLMYTQTQQMHKDRKQLKNKFNGLTIQNADQLIPKSATSLVILTKNVKIYESNLQLFARYNAQTNLKQYANRRKNYTSQYTKFKSLFQSWKQQQKHSQYLYQRHEVLNSFKKKSEVGNSKSSQEWERKKLEQSYLESLSYKIPPQMPNIQGYKFSLVDQFEKIFKRQNIIVPIRQSLPVDKQKSIQYLKNTNKLQNFVDFFVRIKHKPYNQKIQYLLDNQDKIQAMNYQMKHEFQNQSIEEQKYSIGLKYSKAITSYLGEHKIAEKYLSEVEQYSQTRWQALPIGLEAVVFNFTKDVYLKKSALEYLDNVYRKQLQKYSDQMDDQISRVPNWTDYTETSEIPYSANFSDTVDRRQFFFKFVRKITRYSPMIRDELIDEFWLRNQQAVSKSYRVVTKQVKSLGNVNKKNFFSFKILCYLTSEDRKLKVPNIKQLIDYYLGYVDRYDSFRWDQKHFFAQIIKQRILLKYLQSTLLKYMDTKSQINSIKRINDSCMLLYEINDHLNLAKTDELQLHISHSLCLQKSLVDIQEPSYLKTLPITDLKLSDKTDKVIKGMKKQPLILSNKNKFQSYEKIIDIRSKIQNLSRVNNYNHQKRRIQFLSQIYSNCQQLLNALKIISSVNFESSDIIAVRQNNKKMIYLEQIVEKVNQELNDTYIQQIKTLQTIYRGQNVQNYSRISKVQNNKNTSNKAMEQILRNIQQMVIINI